MTESIPTTWNDERDAAFFDIADALAADGFGAGTADWPARLRKVLDDLTVADSWEAMAIRSISHSTPRDRDLVPVRVTARRRSTDQ
jgi:hypothetical protein